MNSTAVDIPTENEPAARDEMVHTAIKFLENPNVINTPLAQKQNFLRRKGMTDKEIQIACEKSGAYNRHDEQKNIPPLLPPANIYAGQYAGHQANLTIFDKIREIVHNIAIFSIVAYIVHKFYEMYIAPFLFGKKKKSIEDSITDLEKDIKISVEELKDDMKSVKLEVDRLSENSSTRQLIELKSEISSVKGLLLGRKQFPSVANSPVVPPSIPAWQLSSVPPDSNDEHDAEERKEDLEELGSGSGSSEPEHGMKTSESSLEIIYSSKDCDSESYSKKSNKGDDKD